jgi:hypothetical protein
VKAMDYGYKIQVVTDGVVTFSRLYEDAVSAVNAYNKFVDHGTCHLWREIVMLEPTGKAHSKTFEHPLAKKLQVN